MPALCFLARSGTGIGSLKCRCDSSGQVESVSRMSGGAIAKVMDVTVAGAQAVHRAELA